MKMKSKFPLLVLAVLGSATAFAFAQDPVHSSSRPWRRQYPSTRTTATRMYQHDYSSHFLDEDELRNDKRARLWSVNLKSRRPNRLSLSTRIVWMNVAAFFLQVARPGFTQWGIKLSEKILKGQEMYRLFTPIFLHGGIFHLFTNCYSLQQVGPDVEKLFGPGRYLATYAVSGIAGNLLSAVMSPNPSLGASSAVFGVVSAYFVFLTRNEWLLGRYGEYASAAIMQTIVANLVLGAMNPVIDNWGHLGGALGGAAMAYYFGPRLYLTDLPNGGRTLIDRPILRLPSSIESIPQKIGTRFKRITRRMHVERFKADIPEKPWRRPRNHRKPPVPPGSIRPRNTKS